MNQAELKAVAEAAKEGACIALKEFLSVKQAALCFGVSTSLIYELLESGLIPHSRKLGKILIPRKRVEKMISDALVCGDLEARMTSLVKSVRRSDRPFNPDIEAHKKKAREALGE